MVAKIFQVGLLGDNLSISYLLKHHSSFADSREAVATMEKEMFTKY